MTDIGYSAAHSRIVRRRGLAVEHQCVDCREPAEQWSYVHTDPNEKTDATGAIYSTDVNNYQPRCRTCHTKFDMRRRRRRAIATMNRTPERKLLLSIDETCNVLNVGCSTVSMLVKEGELQQVAIGRRRLIVAASIDAYVTRLSVSP